MKDMKQQSEHVQHRNLENLTALATFSIKCCGFFSPHPVSWQKSNEQQTGHMKSRRTLPTTTRVVSGILRHSNELHEVGDQLKCGQW